MDPHNLTRALESWPRVSLGFGLTIIGYIYLVLTAIRIIKTPEEREISCSLFLSFLVSLAMLGCGEWLLIDMST